MLSSFKPSIKVHFDKKNALSFNVRDPIEGIVTRCGFMGMFPGAVRPALTWSVNKA